MPPSDTTLPPEVEAELRSLFQLCPPDSHCITCNGQADSVRRAFLLGVEHGQRQAERAWQDNEAGGDHTLLTTLIASDKAFRFGDPDSGHSLLAKAIEFLRLAAALENGRRQGEGE